MLGAKQVLGAMSTLTYDSRCDVS